MVIVTGLGRSGTTVMIQFIEKLGFNIGKPGEYNYNPDIHGGVEHIFVRELNKRIRSTIKKDVDVEQLMPTLGAKEMRKIKDQINDVDFDAFKELVLMTQPAILHAWWKSRKDIGLLICHRRFEEILASAEERAKITGPNERESIEQYKIEFADFITEVSLLGIPYRILMFPYFLLDYDLVYEYLTYLGLEFDKQTGEGIWKELIKFDFVTQTPGFNESV